MRLIISVFIIHFVSCNNETALNEQPPVPDTSSSLIRSDIKENNNSSDTSKAEFNIQPFKKIPSAIDGCSGLFKIDSAGTEYVFAINFDEEGFIQVNDKLLRLKLLEKKNREGYFDQTYSGEGIKVRLQVREVKQLDYELSIYEGTIYVQYQNQYKEIGINGEIGC